MTTLTTEKILMYSVHHTIELGDDNVQRPTPEE
jgi:hypothetical protein